MKDILEEAKTIDGMMPDGDLNLLYDLAERFIKPGGIAVEIGSWKGRSSYVLAAVAKSKGAKLICIDTWAGATDRFYDTYKEALSNPQKFFEDNIKKNLEKFDNVSFIMEDSQTAHKKIKDNSVDFCFVDGDHDLPAVGNDVKNFLPKVKKGGVYLGHDYYYDNRNDVKKVVDDILGLRNIKLVGNEDAAIWVYEK